MTYNGRYSLPGPDTITRVALENGITVLVYENHAAQSVVISGSLDTGSLYESAERNGLAAMTASSLMHGTLTRDFDAMHRALEEIGADLNISAKVHKTGFGGKALAEDLSVLLDLLSDTLRNPVFPAAHVERLRGEMLTWLNYSQQDARYRAARAFREVLYPAEHPYYYPTWGTAETLNTITIDEIREFHHAHFGPRGMILTIVGAVHTDEAVQIVRDRFEDWSNPLQPARPSLPGLPMPEENRRVLVPVAGKTQSEVMIGTHGPSRYDSDYPAAVLANSVLGEFGMMGRIGTVIREELGLAYYAYSRLEGGYGPGAWSVIAGVNPENVDVTIERSVDEVRRLTSELVREEDLADIQSYFTGRLPLKLESNEGIAVNLHTMESFNLGLDYLLNYREHIYSLTREDLLAAASRYFKPDALTVSVAGPH